MKHIFLIACGPVRSLGFIGVLLTASLGVVTGVRAQQSSDIYTVTGIAVDATGTDAEQARTAALAQGRIRAAREVLQRFTLYADWPQLPELDAAGAELLVTGIGVANERTSGTRYLGEVTARLDPRAVRNVLRRSGVRFTENQAAPSLLLPVLDTPGVRALFDEPNQWRAAWEDLGLSNSLVPIILPLGDLEDFAAIDAGGAIGAEWPAVEKIASRYDVRQVLVAYARGEDPTKLDVTLYRVTPSGTESTMRTYTGATLEEAALAGAVGVRNSLIASWKDQNAVALGLEQDVPASVEFASLAEWTAIRNRLNTASIVQRVDVVAISSTGAQINMRVAGPMPALVANLGQQQLRLVDDGGYWTIAMATSPAPSAPAGDAPDVRTPSAPTPADSSASGSAGGNTLPSDEAIADKLTRQNAGSSGP